MFDALVILFQRKNMNRKMAFRNKLRSVQMSRLDNVNNYLMRITQVCDEIAAIGEKTKGVELVNVALNGLPKSWEPFIKGVFSQENIPYWQGLWDDCIQEETREQSKGNKQGGSEENLALVSKTRKGKGKSSSKKGNSDGGSSHPGKKDLIKIKCFSCHENGNYASSVRRRKRIVMKIRRQRH
jgi:hypothetical protein